MASNPQPDFLSDLREASRNASQQEAQSAPVLRELLFSRADSEPEFRKALVNNPEKTIGELAKGIGAAATPELVREVKERYSAAIIGATDVEVKALVFGTLDNVRESFKRTLALSEWLFWVGLALTVAAFVATLFQNGNGWIAGVFGGGGILTLISYAVMNPLDRIRSAAANLVQVQIAYLSFYKQLNMLGGVDLDKMAIDDAVKYSSELRKCAVETIEAVQKIVERTAPYDPRSVLGHLPGDSQPSPSANDNARQR
jgi:hypothetical protein